MVVHNWAVQPITMIEDDALYVECRMNELYQTIWHYALVPPKAR
jgi:hypothetical protein